MNAIHNLRLHINISFLFVLCFGCSLEAQIKGIITDVNKNPIIANVILYKINDNSISAFTQTDEEGHYHLKLNEIGEFFLSVKSLNYSTSQKLIKIENINDKHTFNFILKESNYELDEIVIKATLPIKRHHDTITINSKTFKKGDENVLEDLLKNIPGLSVGLDGIIKYNNQEIEKVMIEGDDFFEKGYRILTKNMPPKPIDKVQVLLNYSNNKLLKDIEKSNKIALNLTLDDSVKRQWFGNLELGNDVLFNDFYKARINLMSFNKKSKYYFLSGANSTGNDLTGDLNNFIQSYRYNEPGRIGDDIKASNLLNLSPFLFGFNSKRSEFNNSELASLNGIFNLNDKLKIKTNGLLKWNNIDFSRKSNNSFFANNTGFTNIEDYNLNNKSFVTFGKIVVNYDLYENQTIESETSYSYKNQNDTSLLDFNDNLTNELLYTTTSRFNHNTLYTKKISDNKVLLISGRVINESSPQKYEVNQVFFSESLFSDVNFQPDKLNQNTKNELFYRGLNIHLLNRKKNGDLFEFSFSNEYHKYQLNNVFILRNNETNNVAAPEAFQNKTTYVLNDFNAKLKYDKEWNKKYRISGEIELHKMFNELKTLNRIEQNPFFINPKLNFNYRINKKNQIGFGFFYNTINADILDVFDGFHLVGFRSLKRGTRNINQLDATGGNFTYQLGNWVDKFFATANILYKKNHDFFSYNQIIEPNVSISESIIIKDRTFFTFNTNIDYYLSKFRTNIKLKNQYDFSNFKNVINNSDLRNVQNRNYNIGLELRSTFKGWFNFHLGTSFKFIDVKTKDFTNSFINNDNFIDVFMKLNEYLDVQIKGEHFFFGNISGNNNYYFLDYDVSYKLKNSKWSFSLESRNLTNTKKFTTSTLTDVSSNTIIYDLLPRYILLGTKYRF